MTPWTVACQVPVSMACPRQKYWSGLPFPTPGDLLDPGIKPRSASLQANSLSSEPPGKQSIIRRGQAVGHDCWEGFTGQITVSYLSGFLKG